nr:SLAM family member 6 [Cavia porcellus]
MGRHLGSQGGNAASQSSSSTMVVNGVVGESVTLPVKFPAEKKIQAVSWSYNMTFIGICQPSEMTNTLILNPANNKKMNYTQSCFLHFSNLTRKDSGPYRAQINTLTFETLFFDFALRVFERLHNLQVSHHIQLSGNGTCEIHLTCYVENPDDSVSFEWQLSENIFLNETNLTVSWDSKDSRDQSYVCTAKNSVSNVSFPVSAKNLCKDILTKDNLHWKNLTWIIICVILIITFILMIICKKKTGKFLPSCLSSLVSSLQSVASDCQGSVVEDRRREGGCKPRLSFVTGVTPRL